MTYTTIQGDLWDLIAVKTLGSSDYTDLLMRANPAHITTFQFPAGVTLQVPALPDPEPASTLPPWKR